MVPQNTIKLGPQPFDRLAALMVQKMRPKFHRDALQTFKRVRQQ
jgi:hypothetical protein